MDFLGRNNVLFLKMDSLSNTLNLFKNETSLPSGGPSPPDPLVGAFRAVTHWSPPRSKMVEPLMSNDLLGAMFAFLMLYLLPNFYDFNVHIWKYEWWQAKRGSRRWDTKYSSRLVSEFVAKAEWSWYTYHDGSSDSFGRNTFRKFSNKFLKKIAKMHCFSIWNFDKIFENFQNIS